MNVLKWLHKEVFIPMNSQEMGYFPNGFLGSGYVVTGEQQEQFKRELRIACVAVPVTVAAILAGAFVLGPWVSPAIGAVIMWTILYRRQRALLSNLPQVPSTWFKSQPAILQIPVVFG